MADRPDLQTRQANTFQSRYTYDQIIVGSKTGEALMAFDEENLEFVVIKRPDMLQPNPDLLQASIADLAREEHVLSIDAIHQHPAVCRLLSVGEFENQHNTYRYIVLERARGTPVPDLIDHYHQQGKSFPERTYLEIMQKLLDLLAVTHQANVVYNDVKAEHLFWDDKAARLKVIDWGNARTIGDNGSITPDDDVFQCGELLYEFATASKYTPVTFNEWQTAGRPEWKVALHNPTELTTLLSRALHPDSTQRYPDAAAMAADLQHYIRHREAQMETLRKQATYASESNDLEQLKQGENALTQVLAYDPHDASAQALWNTIRQRIAALQTPEQLRDGLHMIYKGQWELAQQIFAALDGDLTAQFWHRYAEVARQTRDSAFHRLAADISGHLMAEDEQFTALEALLATNLDQTLDSPHTMLLALVGEYLDHPLLITALSQTYTTLQDAIQVGQQQLTRELSGAANGDQGAIRSKWDIYLTGLESLEAFLSDAYPANAYAGATNPQAMAIIYENLAGQLVDRWKKLGDTIPDHAVTAYHQALVSGLDQAAQIARNTGHLLQDAQATLARREYNACKTYIQQAEQLDPHNPQLAELRQAIEMVHNALAYQHWLSPTADIAAFGAWVQTANTALNRALQLAPQDTGLMTEQQNAQTLRANWRAVIAAAQVPNVTQLQLAVNGLSDHITQASYNLPVVAMGKRLRFMAQNKPWHFLDNAEFAASCDNFLAILLNVKSGELRTATDRLESLAETPAQTQWAEYLITLGAAQQAIDAGQLDAARNHLTKIQNRPIREQHWTLESDLHTIAQTIADHDLVRAKTVYDDLVDYHGPKVQSMTLIKRFAAQIEKLTGHRNTLERFVETPERAHALLEKIPRKTWPAVFNQISECASMIEASIAHWRNGEFSAAQHQLEKAHDKIKRLPEYLGVDLATAVAAVQQHSDRLQQCRDELNAARQYVETCRNQSKTIDQTVVHAHLKAIASLTPDLITHSTDESSRPMVWLRTFDQLAILPQKDFAELEHEHFLKERQILPTGPVYPVFYGYITQQAQSLGVIEPLAEPVATGTSPLAISWRHTLRRLIRHLPTISRQLVVGAVILGMLAIVGAIMISRIPDDPTPAPTTDVAETIPTSAPVTEASTATEISLPTTAPVELVQTMPPQPCEQIATAMQNAQWAQIITAIEADPTLESCNGQPVEQIMAMAHFEIGRELYQQDQFAEATQQWTTALELGLIPGPADKLLMACASARQVDDAAVLEALVAEYGTETVMESCLFDPAAYAPVEIDLLAQMAAQNLTLSGSCYPSPCPALYQDDNGAWYLNTFYGNDHAFLVMGERFQVKSTGQSWGERVRRIDLTFAVNSLSPYLFPYGTRIGLLVNDAEGSTIWLIMTSEPDFSALANVTFDGLSVDACPLSISEPITLIDDLRQPIPHTISFQWNPDHTLQFFVDGRALCQTPIQLSDAPEVMLYMEGNGTNLSVIDLTLTLAPQ